MTHELSGVTPYGTAPPTASLADILERVLDKGIVIAGDIKIDLLDIELLTIRLRLFISSVETARKAGIDWWETDPALSSRAARLAQDEEKRQLRERVAELERAQERAEERAQTRELDRHHDEDVEDGEDSEDRDQGQDREQERKSARARKRTATAAPRRTRREVSR